MRADRIRIVIFGLLLVSLVSFGPVREAKPAHSAIPLCRPAFLAQEVTTLAGYFDSTAGIAAYYNAKTPINLTRARALFTALEQETDQYLIGSIRVPDYPSKYDIHVFLHRDGWVMAYYLNKDPAAMMIDWIYFHTSNQAQLRTKHEAILQYVAGQLRLPYEAPTFYDFRNPGATHLMIILKWTSGRGAGDQFQVQLPSLPYAFYDQGWGLGGYVGRYECNFRYSLGDRGIASFWVSCNNCWGFAEGAFSASDLPPNVYRTISISAAGGSCYDAYTYGVLILIYRAP
jgi:hypothetical protein